jgi:AcrR family transcriptional regulator
MAKDGPETRRLILRAAQKRFANAGYAATSVQDIVDDAKVSKPALYYHFKDKAGLFQALVHEAHDERYRVLREAAARGGDIRTQLENLLAALFDFFRGHRELIRISVATMFAAPGEVPENLGYADKCERNFEFVHSLIKRAQNNGGLDRHFDSQELTFGFYGMANFYLVANIVSPDCEPDQLTAKRIVELFLAGAGPKAGAKKFKQPTKGEK